MIEMTPYSLFSGDRLLAQGSLCEVSLAAKAARGDAPLLVFDAEARPVDLDLRGDAEAVAARYSQPAPETRGRGRPKLGVIAREVTLLPRHWDWLAAQRGGASQALRRLIDEARRADGDATERRAASEAAYRFMTTMAGNRAGYEEAIRALFAAHEADFAHHTAAWPQDLRDHARALAAPAFATSVHPTPA